LRGAVRRRSPNTRLLKRAGGKSVQGFNAQVVASPEQVIIAAEVTQSHNDADQLEPMVAHATETLREAGIGEPIGILLADGGYWNSPAISEVVCSTPEGQALYRRRQQIVEPVFAHTKVIRRSDRFLRRGLAAWQAEWKLIVATHNLLKIWRFGLAHAQGTIVEPLTA
jgi:hypothetical protein